MTKIYIIDINKYKGKKVLGMYKVKNLTTYLVISILLSSCSVGMALSGNEQKDISVFYYGAHRSFVHAKTGLPSRAIQDKEGKWTDTYLIVKGNEPSAGRAIGHGIMDVLTLGVWEIIGTPIEAIAGEEEHDRFTIYYDGDDKIENIERVHIEARPVEKDANLKNTDLYPIDHAN